MTIVMNMSGYEIEREEVADEEYGDEVMYAELVPQLVLINDSRITEVDKHVELPSELADVDVEDFLKRMYEYQS